MEFSSDSDRDCDFSYQPEQILFGKGHFNGRIYLPDSDDLDAEESTVPARKQKGPVSNLRSKTPSSSPWTHDKPTHKGKDNEKLKRKRLPSSHLPSDRNITVRLPNVTKTTTAGDDNKENSPIADQRKDLEESTDSVLKQIQKTNDLLGVVAKRLDSTERRLSKMENDIWSTRSSSSSDNSTNKARKKVPLLVSRERRRVYGMLQQEGENFLGWNVEPGKSFKDEDNQRTLQQLVREVKGLQPDFSTQQIHDAAYRYYLSLCEEASAERNGKSVSDLQRKRRHERLARKLQERRAALRSMTFDDNKHRNMWENILSVEMMSSENSGDDSSDDTIFVKPLPWRSSEVNSFMARLDEQTLSTKSVTSKRMSRKRTTGEDSARSQPSSEDLPLWAFSKK